MGLLKLITENTDTFKLSYTVPYNRIPYLLDKLMEHNPNFVSKESNDGTTYVMDKDTNEVILKYEFDSRTLFSDYTFNQLLTLGAK